MLWLCHGKGIPKAIARRSSIKAATKQMNISKRCVGHSVKSLGDYCMVWKGEWNLVFGLGPSCCGFPSQVLWRLLLCTN